MIAREAIRSGRGVAELVLEHNLLSQSQLEDILRPEVLTQPYRMEKLHGFAK